MIFSLTMITKLSVVDSHNHSNNIADFRVWGLGLDLLQKTLVGLGLRFKEVWGFCLKA